MTQTPISPSPRKRGPSKTSTWLLLAALAAGLALYTRYADRIMPIQEDPALSQAEMVILGGPLYAEHCASCHGKSAQGQDPLRPGGGLTDQGAFIAPALNGTGHAWHHPPDALFSIVKHGSPAPESPMKALGGKLSDLEIKSVLAYVMSLWPEEVKTRYDKHMR